MADPNLRCRLRHPSATVTVVRLHRRHRRRICRDGLFAALILGCSLITHGDVITVRDDAGKEVTIEVRWVAAGKDAVALERRDGRWEVIPDDRVVRRTPAADPQPLSPEDVLPRLEQEFDPERLVTHVAGSFVIALHTAKPLGKNKRGEKRWEQQLKKAARFLDGMQTGFLDFAKDAELDLHEPKFPLVVMIFENDREFDQYVTRETEGQGLSAEKIASFYNLLTNRLVLRLRECKTFTTPLHEAIHQQAHNRGVLQRLAPVPAWFNEGLATAFEGDGERVKSGPKAFNRRYATIAVNAKKTSWADIVRDDAAFQGDILAGEAYGQAWALHWWLYTRHRPAYRKLLRHYSELEPLTSVAAEEREKAFGEIVGSSTEVLQREFMREATKLLQR